MGDRERERRMGGGAERDADVGRRPHPTSLHNANKGGRDEMRRQRETKETKETRGRGRQRGYQGLPRLSSRVLAFVRRVARRRMAALQVLLCLSSRMRRASRGAYAHFTESKSGTPSLRCARRARPCLRTAPRLAHPPAESCLHNARRKGGNVANVLTILPYPFSRRLASRMILGAKRLPSKKA